MPQRHAPATGRNRSFILETLKQVLPAEGTVLEVASGTGEHAVYCAPALQGRRWLPSDISDENLASIDAWRSEFPSDNLLAPIKLDASASIWPVEQTAPTAPICAIVSINMIHITPWACCEGLFAAAGRILQANPTTGEPGVLFLYGPFMRDGRHTAPSNAQFDRQLKERDSRWGIRSVEDIVALGTHHGLQCTALIDMPANNLSVVFKAQ